MSRRFSAETQIRNVTAGVVICTSNSTLTRYMYMYILPTAKLEFLKSGHVVLDVGTGRLMTKLLPMTYASATYTSIESGQ